MQIVRQSSFKQSSCFSLRCFPYTAALVTITLGEFKKRAKHVMRAGSATATAVVQAIGQRVQDIASFYAINAVIQQKQEAYLVQRQAHRSQAVSQSYESSEQGMDGLELGGEHVNDPEARTAYINKMHEVCTKIAVHHLKRWRVKLSLEYLCQFVFCHHVEYLAKFYPETMHKCVASINIFRYLFKVWVGELQHGSI